MHVGQDSADEVTARRILHDLDVADVIATSEEEARQRQAEARRGQAQLRSALRTSLQDGALPLPSPEISPPEISPPESSPPERSPPEISPPEITPPTADPPPAALPCDALPRRPTPRFPWLQSCDAQCGGGCRASGAGVPRACPPLPGPPPHRQDHRDAEGKAVTDKAANAKFITVPAAEARAALQHAAEQGALAGAQLGAEMVTEQLQKEKEAAVAAARAEGKTEKEAAVKAAHAEGAVNIAIMSIELRAQEDAVKDVIGASVAAQRAAYARISTLQQQIGGGNWLSAVQNAKRAAEDAKAEQAAAKTSNATLQAKTKELKDLIQIVDPKMRAKGAALAKELGSEAAVRIAGHVDQLEQPTPANASEVGLTERHLDRLAGHLESELFAGGGGDISRTRLLAAAIQQRPAMQRVFASSPTARRREARMNKLNEVARAMMAKCAQTLKELTCTRGSRAREDHERFESIVASMIPDDATPENMMRAIGELLEIHWEQIDRAQQRQLKNDGSKGAFSRSTKVSSKQRKDKNVTGRRQCRMYWHEQTRFDTNSRKKRRLRVGKNTYIEHWRRIQYDTNQQMYDTFLGSPEYRKYRAEGGVPISETVFFQEKCKCIVKADHEECACPICTQMQELLRDWQKQREVWHRESAGACPCGACDDAKSPYRMASHGVHELNTLLLCAHELFPSLQIDSGPHSCEEVKFRRRQCCHVPLLDKKGEKIDDGCKTCGWEKRMPKCPIENSAAHPAEWKEYCARGPSSSGSGNQEDLVTVRGTRAEMMAQLKKIYALWLSHSWIKRWCEHQRKLTYATFDVNEACIMTDFSAIYDHKAFASKCCEQPHHSMMDVFVVSWARIVNGHREVSITLILTLTLTLALALTLT